MDEEQRRSITELRRFTVCQFADALGSSCAVETAIQPVDCRVPICGPAFTVECAPGDNLTLHHALHLAQPGDVLVVGGSPDCEVALWGELMSISAQSRGLAGTVVDGPVRDQLEIRTLGYPVFYRRFDPRRAAKKSYGRINVPIRVGSISVSAKDLVMADANGIMSIPHARVQEAVQLAFDVAQKESKIKEQIRSGRTLFEIFELEKYITSSQ